ncbi:MULTISPECIES: hypothetical protein [Spirulina sp. CCY15215]|uniref:hypothetical protein n=1 Tax=Spirulina sp. CCY15215 TaxID=2767591 RepID=UPI00194E892B|nr:hypothetical protein [Spirulina major]
MKNTNLSLCKNLSAGGQGKTTLQIIKNYCDNLEKTNKYVLEIKVLNILYLYNIGICKIDIGEFEEGIKYLQEVIFKTEKSDLLYSYNVRALLNLASLFASTGKSKEASKLAVKLESEINYVELGVRSTAYRFYHLGKIFQYLEDLDKSLYYYRKAKEYRKNLHLDE